MGIEQHLFNTFLGESKALNKRWVVHAKDVEDATGKVVSFCKDLLTDLERKSLDKNIDIDISFTLLDANVTEI